MIGLRLSKAGYGNPLEIINWPSDLVLDALDYESFTNLFEEAFMEANKDLR